MNGSVLTSLAPLSCPESQENFSAYLDGALDGGRMRALSAHLDTCATCRAEFAAWRSVQSVLGELGPAPVPPTLQAELRDALAGERGRRSHLSPTRRLAAFTRRTFAPLALRSSAGLAATLLLLGGSACFLGLAYPVQANDDRLAHLYAPRFLYAQAQPAPIPSRAGSSAVLLDAKVDARGRVYDYTLIDGPSDPQTRLAIQKNLLSSVFKPATIFGEAVPGDVMVVYITTTVSAHS